MKRLYTLKEKLTGSAGVSLNGKIFILKKDPAGHIHFLDAQQENVELWITSTCQNLEYTASGIRFTTENSVYELLDVSFLIPTAAKVSEDQEEELSLISEEYGPSKMINYGDGYSITYCTFNKPVSEDEIRTWFKENSRIYKRYDEVPWYEDYVELKLMNSDGTKWEVKRIRRYTD